MQPNIHVRMFIPLRLHIDKNAVLPNKRPLSGGRDLTSTFNSVRYSLSCVRGAGALCPPQFSDVRGHYHGDRSKPCWELTAAAAGTDYIPDCVSTGYMATQKLA